MEQILQESSNVKESQQKFTMLGCPFCAHLWLGRGNYDNKVICSNDYTPAHCSGRRASDPDATKGDQAIIEIIWDNDIIWENSENVDKEIMYGKGFFLIDVFNRFTTGISLAFVLVSDDGAASKLFYFSNKSLTDVGLTNEELIEAITEYEDKGMVKISAGGVLPSGVYPINEKIKNKLKKAFKNPEAVFGKIDTKSPIIKKE